MAYILEATVILFSAPLGFINENTNSKARAKTTTGTSRERERSKQKQNEGLKSSLCWEQKSKELSTPAAPVQQQHKYLWEGGDRKYFAYFVA